MGMGGEILVANVLFRRNRSHLTNERKVSAHLPLHSACERIGGPLTATLRGESFPTKALGSDFTEQAASFARNFLTSPRFLRFVMQLSKNAAGPRNTAGSCCAAQGAAGIESSVHLPGSEGLRV